MEKCLSIDWVSILVKMPKKAFETWPSRYTIRKDSKNTRHFRQIHYIYAPDGDEVGYVAHDPHSGILEADTGLFKLNNKYLYQMAFKQFVIGLLNDLGMTFKSFSRIDLALDFQKFSNNLSPANFMKYYISDKYLKLGKTQGALHFKEGSSKGKKYETLKFGSKTSDIQYYLYNKSEEMRCNKKKQWIEDNWRANGYDGDGDVWRLEYRITKTNKGVYKLNEDTGELDLFFDMTDINCIDNIQELYKHLFTKYFSFVRNEKKSRKDRCKPLHLFGSDLKLKGVSIKLSEHKEADRASRIFAKHFVKLEHELRGLDFGLAILANEMVGYFIHSRGLTDWADNKLDYKVSERQKELWNSRAISSQLSDAQYMSLGQKINKSHNIIELLKNQKQ